MHIHGPTWQSVMRHVFSVFSALVSCGCAAKYPHFHRKHANVQVIVHQAATNTVRVFNPSLTAGTNLQLMTCNCIKCMGSSQLGSGCLWVMTQAGPHILVPCSTVQCLRQYHHLVTKNGITVFCFSVTGILEKHFYKLNVIVLHKWFTIFIWFDFLFKLNIQKLQI